MAKKPKQQHRTPLVSLAELEARARRALTEGRTQQALELVKQLYKQEATPPHQELLRQVYLARARQLRSLGYARDACTVLDNALQLNSQNPAWLEKVAEELAACGNPRRAMELMDRLPQSPALLRVQAQATDTAVRQGAAGRNVLPESLRNQFDVVLRAFGLVEAGQDDQARDALQQIGLQSPFLEWKLLLRGLAGYYQKDDVRALENWQRLDADRLPAQLTAPLRFQIDPAYRQAQSPETQIRLQKQADRLQGSGLVPALRALQASMAHPEQLSQAFRAAETLLPALRKEAPPMVQRLASCFFWAIVHGGQPEDMTRYRRVFGEPADDPGFCRLQALVMEQGMGDLKEAHKWWRQFEEQVAANPAAWPGEQANRVRALVWGHMGRNAAFVPDIEDMDHLPPFLRDHPARPKPLNPPADKCFERALELAPDQLESYEDLYHYYQQKKKDKPAEDIARRLLERFPDHVATLEALSDQRLHQGDCPQAILLLERAMKANPLERRLRHKLSTAHLFNARQFAESSRFEEARTEYHAAQSLDDEDRSSILCKWAACEFKAGDTARAEELLGQALARTGSHLAMSFSMLIEAIRLKLPRPLKTRFDQAFKAALAEPATGQAAVLALETAAAHHLAGVEYYGQKTHEKKVLAYLDQVPPGDFTEAQLQGVCEALLGLEASRPLHFWCGQGQRLFPNNPHFPFLEAESYIAKGPGECPVWKVGPLLAKAEQLAQALPADPKQKDLLEIIRQRKHALGALNPATLGMLQNAFEQIFGYGNEEDVWDPDDEDDWLDDEYVDDEFLPFSPPPKPRKKKRRKHR